MHVAIIGNGITGVTAALTLRELQPEWRISLISGESTYHYSRPALMYVFMGHMRYKETKPYENKLWAEKRIDLVRGWVTRIDSAGKRLEMHQGEAIAYDKLLVATGSSSNKFGWPGQDLPGVQGLYSLMDLKALYENVKGAKSAVIVGGGLIGIELGEMLHSRHIHVTFLVRENSYWSNVLPPEESAMINRLIRDTGMDLRLETELGEIVAGEGGRVSHVLTKSGERIECQIVGLTAGVRPNLAVVEGSEIAVGRGILVDWTLQTNVADVYAAGDCAEIVKEGEARNLLQQVWYTGKAQGRCVAHALAGSPQKYEPGIWYNSAKFLDLEYQTYGMVWPRPREGERHLWWGHPNGVIGVRLVGEAGVFKALNTMGIRMRHRVCERWIREERTLEYVIAHLAEANFDPEFYLRHESVIAAALRAQLEQTEVSP
jgi:NAD(P)H-nitrite reductase large subunit